MKTDKNIGKKIKEVRELLDLPKTKFAEMLGINRVALDQIEKGTRKFFADELLRFTKKLGIDPDNFLFDTKKAYKLRLQKEVLRSHLVSIRKQLDMIENLLDED